ncbi:MAG: hypothetical protein AAGG02_01355 [Cyanobacteria bacterium P01_H01_bin.15]
MEVETLNKKTHQDPPSNFNDRELVYTQQLEQRWKRIDGVLTACWLNVN